MQTGKWQGRRKTTALPSPATQVTRGEQGRKYDIFNGFNATRILSSLRGSQRVGSIFKFRLILVTASDIYIPLTAASDILQVCSKHLSTTYLCQPNQPLTWSNESDRPSQNLTLKEQMTASGMFHPMDELIFQSKYLWVKGFQVSRETLHFISCWVI